MKLLHKSYVMVQQLTLSLKLLGMPTFWLELHLQSDLIQNVSHCIDNSKMSLHIYTEHQVKKNRTLGQQKQKWDVWRMPMQDNSKWQALLQ